MQNAEPHDAEASVAAASEVAMKTASAMPAVTRDAVRLDTEQLDMECIFLPLFEIRRAQSERRATGAAAVRCGSASRWRSGEGRRSAGKRARNGGLLRSSFGQPVCGPR